MSEPTWDDLFGQSDDATPPPSSAAPNGAASVQPTSLPPRAPGTPTTPTFASEQPSRRSLREADVRPRTRSPRGGGKPPRRKGRLIGLIVVLVILLLGVAGSAVVWSAFGPQIRQAMGWDGPNDYAGTGDGQPATITIMPGQIGSDIAKSLASAGVTKTAAAFYSLLLKQTTQPNFQPGTYKLQKQMSAKAALAQLLDPKNRVISKVVIPEGMTLTQILAKLAATTGAPLADLQAAAKNYTALGVPKGAPSLEGFLFPATYQFDPGLPAKTILQHMVDRMNQALTSHGVSKANELKVLTLASIVQKEGGSTKDFYKVARVFQNRLDQGIHLQSDATVSYGAHSAKIATTAAQRADLSNKYNTYAHAGLPIGPISAPGDAAIDAAMHPAKGSWLYFVLVNGSTGQTVFSDTLAQHDIAVAQWQTWLRAHPGYGQ
jgi:UPF0755 protein